MAVNNWRVLFLSTGNVGEEIVTGIHVKADKAGAGAWSADEVAGYVKDWLETAYKNLLTTDDRLDEIRVTEHKSDPADVPSQASRFPNLAGAQSGVDNKLPREACVWVSVKSAVPLRAARSGHHLPPWRHSAWLTTGGTFNTSSAIWPFVTTWVDALKNGHDVGVAGVDGHLSTIIWSQTRVLRGQSPHDWDAQNVVPSSRVAWLRSRRTIP